MRFLLLTLLVLNSHISLGKSLSTEVSSQKSEQKLFSAIRDGNEFLVRNLVQTGVSLESTESGGITPLMTAIEFEQENLVTYLIEKGAKLEAQNENGETALWYAAEGENKKNFDLLISHGANTHIITKVSGDNLIIRLASSNKIDFLESVLKKEKNQINFVNKEGETALFEPARMNNVNMLKLLTKYDIDTGIKNKKGFTALDCAKDYKAKKSITYLNGIKKGLDKTNP